MRHLVSILALGAMACSPTQSGGGGGDADTAAGDTADTGETEGPLEHRTTFVVLADPHVTGPGEHEERLLAAVEAVNAMAEERGIELVVILGDIAWNNGFDEAHTALAQLDVPWVPVMGDNEVQSLDEEAFHDAFADQIAALGGQLDGLEVMPTPVENPERGGLSWFQNLRFEHQGVRFLAVDWSSREIGNLWGETPDLHDFQGGTWPWLEEQLDQTTGMPDDSVILLSHMPLFEGPGGLIVDEADVVKATFLPHEAQLWANLAGHLHASSSMDWAAAGIEVHVTDATWDDTVTFRLIDVAANEARFVYSQELITVEGWAR